MHSRYSGSMAMSVSDVRQSVASEVRALLARKRISVSEAARRLGVGQSWLHRRVVGEIPFDVGEISAVADLLETPVETFFAGTGNAGTGEGIRKRSFWRRRHDQRFSVISPAPARAA
jgi:hypothetical protein